MNQCTSLSYYNHFQTCFSKLYCLFQKLDMFVFCTHKNFLLNGNNNFLRTYWNVIIWFRRRKVLIKSKEKWFNIKEILPYIIIKSRMFAVWYAIKLQVLTELKRKNITIFMKQKVQQSDTNSWIWSTSPKAFPWKLRKFCNEGLIILS